MPNLSLNTDAPRRLRNTLEIMVKRCTSAYQPGWLTLRAGLWPHGSIEEHLAEMSLICAKPDRYSAFVAHDEFDEPIGFAEVAIRSDYVNGTSTTPVAFLEGLYVKPVARRKGVARDLVAKVAEWALETGCTEFASDAALDNSPSHAVHKSLGFEETERVVYFRRSLV